MIQAEPSRTDRRKARTRASLIGAARELIAEGRAADVSIQEITQRADLGFGTFYTVVSSKQELFGLAIAETLELYGQWVDALVAGVDDPAEVFAMSLRLSGRLAKSNPQIAVIVREAKSALMTSEIGIAPRGRRDLQAAVAAGRFDIDDIEVALAGAAGALIGLIELIAANPEIDIEQATDAMTLQILRMFGLTRAEAEVLIEKPLPAQPTLAFE